MFSFLKKEKSGAERRRAERVPKYYIARCDIDGKKSFSTVVDVSAVGVGIYISDKYQLGTNVKLILQYEYENGQYSANALNMHLKGKIVWIREASPDEEFIDMKDAKFRAGVELAKMTAAEKSVLQDLLKKS